MVPFRSRISIPAFSAFIPFGTFLVSHLNRGIPLRWLVLASLLKSISLLSICVNILASDFLWSIFGVYTYIAVCTPVYLSAVKAHHAVDDNCDKITFLNLFKTCSNAIFSDYEISLIAQIPLAVQALVGGSMLYGVFGADWIMHSLAGFGIGLIAFKAYITAGNYYGYDRLASYFRLDRFRVFKVELKTGSAEFTLFSLAVVSSIWEIFERVVSIVSPVNVFRLEAEPLWNTIGDVAFVTISGMAAWYILKSKLKWVST